MRVGHQLGPLSATFALPANRMDCMKQVHQASAPTARLATTNHHMAVTPNIALRLEAAQFAGWASTLTLPRLSVRTAQLGTTVMRVVGLEWLPVLLALMDSTLQVELPSALTALVENCRVQLVRLPASAALQGSTARQRGQ
jgi:hypothetical protein